MNHPRRLLLLVPFALLGAAFFVRSRPTEGDKYLWEMGEKVPELRFNFQGSGIKEWQECGLQYNDVLYITDRQGVRACFRAFESTSNFVPESAGNNNLSLEVMIGYFYFPLTQQQKSSGGGYQINVYENSQGCILSKGDDEIATTDCKSLVQLRQVLHDATEHARHGENGYQIGNIGA